jgi:hypothetical protein
VIQVIKLKAQYIKKYKVQSIKNLNIKGWHIKKINYTKLSKAKNNN